MDVKEGECIRIHNNEEVLSQRPAGEVSVYHRREASALPFDETTVSEIGESFQALTATSSALVAGVVTSRCAASIYLDRYVVASKLQLRRGLNRFVNLNYAICGCIIQEAFIVRWRTGGSAS
jgi:hypothetical protein